MALPLIAESLDAIPEAFRGEYTETDGKFKLNVDGVEDVTGLKNTLAKFKADQKAAADKLKAFEGVDPDEYKTLKQEREALEEAKLKAEGKADELAQRKIEKALAAKNKEIEAFKQEAELARQESQSLKHSVLDGHISKAVAGIIHTSAIDDAQMWARQLFTLKGTEAVMLDEDGNVKLGKDGKTPYSPKEWIEEMREQKPHWFPASSSGGGASGSGFGTSSKKAMTTTAFNALSPKDRAKFMADGGRLIEH